MAEADWGGIAPRKSMARQQAAIGARIVEAKAERAQYVEEAYVKQLQDLDGHAFEGLSQIHMSLQLIDVSKYLTLDEVLESTPQAYMTAAMVEYGTGRKVQLVVVVDRFEDGYLPLDIEHQALFDTTEQYLELLLNVRGYTLIEERVPGLRSVTKYEKKGAQWMRRLVDIRSHIALEHNGVLTAAGRDEVTVQTVEGGIELCHARALGIRLSGRERPDLFPNEGSVLSFAVWPDAYDIPEGDNMLLYLEGSEYTYKGTLMRPMAAKNWDYYTQESTWTIDPQTQSRELLGNKWWRTDWLKERIPNTEQYREGPIIRSVLAYLPLKCAPAHRQETARLNAWFGPAGFTVFLPHSVIELAKLLGGSHIDYDVSYAPGTRFFAMFEERDEARSSKLSTLVARPTELGPDDKYGLVKGWRDARPFPWLTPDEIKAEEEVAAKQEEAQAAEDAAFTQRLEEIALTPEQLMQLQERQLYGPFFGWFAGHIRSIVQEWRS